jgi:hypothetical protein
MRSTLNQLPDDRKLRFTENGTFQVSIFEDLHFAESISLHLHTIKYETTILTKYSDAIRDAMTKEAMAYVLSEEDSQLVVLNGDLISGEAVQSSKSSQYLHEIVSPLVNTGQLWASTYGNHDSEVALDPMKDIYEQETRYPNSLTRSMVSSPKAGIKNYYLLIYPHGHKTTAPALILWFFDSKGGHYATDHATGGRPIAREDCR